MKKWKKWKKKNENEETSHAHHFANNTKDSHVSSINPISNILQWTPLYMITVTVISCLLWSYFIGSICYTVHYFTKLLVIGIFQSLWSDMVKPSQWLIKWKPLNAIINLTQIDQVLNNSLLTLTCISSKVITLCRDYCVKKSTRWII
jgi:hypothetical protein